MPTTSEGFAAPPEKNRFKKGGPPGPGRPRGSKSQDTLMRQEYSRKRKVRIEGKDRVMTSRELMVATEFNLALKGDRQARRFIMTEAQRLYREENEARPPESVGAQPSPTETDAAILQWYRADILAEAQQLQGNPESAPPEDWQNSEDPDDADSA